MFLISKCFLIVVHVMIRILSLRIYEGGFKISFKRNPNSKAILVLYG